MKNKVQYCPVGEPQKQFGMYVTGAGSETTKPGEPYPHGYHSSDYYFTWDKGRALADWEYQLLYIRSGEGVIEFRHGRKIRLKGGSVVLLRPGEWHRYRPNPKTGWTEAYIGIGGLFLEHIIAEPFFSKQATVIQLSEGGTFEHDLLALIAEVESFNTERPYSIALRVATLIATLIEATHADEDGNTSNVPIRRAHLYIAHHLNEAIDFAALARKHKMSYSLFRKRFREYTKMAPLEYQLALRIRRAAHLLTSSDAPVAQIAKELGFNSAAYFSRFFRSATGRSPIGYRRA